MKNPLRTKLYYTISEVADLTELQPYTLRAWEKEYSCLRPKRSRGNNRAYRERDIGIILLIKHLLYNDRYTSQGVKQRLKSEPELVREAAKDLSAMLDPEARSRILGSFGLAADVTDSGSAPGLVSGEASVPPASREDMRDLLQAVRHELRALLELI